MNHCKEYMFDIPYVHVLVNADCKFSLVHMQRFYTHPRHVGIIDRNQKHASFDQSVSLLKMFWKKNNAINI